MSAPGLSGQRIVIIGGSSGVGFAVAQCALAAGANVIIGSSSFSKVEAATKQLGERAQGSAVNVSDDASVSAFFAAAKHVDHLVFTAGDGGSVLTPRSVTEMDLSSAGEGFGIRFWGALRAIQHALGSLSESGSITLTSGIMSRRPRKGLALAGAISGAIEHLVQGLAVDLAPRRVNAVCLGFTLTEDHAGKMSEEQIRNATSRQLLQRAGRPEEAAQAYLYAMRGTYTTGQVLITDGGRILG